MPHLTPSPSTVSPRSSTSRLRRTAAGSAVLLVASSALLLSAGTTADAASTQRATCTDGGGVRWSARAEWGATYRGADGVQRVSIDYAGWTTRARVVPTDSAVRTFAPSGTLLQELSWTGAFDYRSGRAYKARNPLNPPSGPGRTKVTVTLGVDGDGAGDCTVTFLQPGADTPPPSTPPPTSPPPTTPPPTTPPPTTPPPTTPPPSTPPGSASDVYEADVLTITNQERTSRGLVALSAQQCVDSFAEAQARRMAAESRMYHQDLGPILNECNLRMVGENVAYGYRDGRAVMEGWMNSPGHRANILNERYRLLGVGASQNNEGRWYSAQVFGTQG